MSTENSEFAVPEVVADEKEATKEIKGTKRPAEVSTQHTYLPSSLFFYYSHYHIPEITHLTI